MKVTTDQKRLSLSFAASIGAHIALLLLIVMVNLDKPLPKKQPPEIMDVVLLDPETTPKTQPPEDAQTLSNKSALGRNSQTEDRVTRSAKAPTTSPQPDKQKPAPQTPPKTPPPPQQQTKPRTRTLTRKDTDSDAEMMPKETTKKETPQKKPSLKPIPMGKLLPSSTALAQISREFDREQALKQMLSREGDIPINTKEAKFAPYARFLVQVLEEQWRPGQANYHEYQEDERRVLIRVSIEHNGELGGVEILRPSPIASMNESAIRAIHEAAPFKPLPSAWGMDRANFYLSFEVFEDKFVFRTLH